MAIEGIERNQRMSRIVKHDEIVYLCGQECADASKDITDNCYE